MAGPAGGRHALGARRTLLFGAGFVLCATILVVTVVEKFARGRLAHGARDGHAGGALLPHPQALPHAPRRRWSGCTPSWATCRRPRTRPLRRARPEAARRRWCWWPRTAASASTRCSTSSGRSRGSTRDWSSCRSAWSDSGEFKGEGAVDELQSRTAEMLERYLELARGMGVPGRVPLGRRHRRGGHRRAAVPRRGEGVPQVHLLLRQDGLPEASAGTTRSCTTTPRSRSRSGCSGRARRWSRCRCGCGRRERRPAPAVRSRAPLRASRCPALGARPLALGARPSGPCALGFRLSALGSGPPHRPARPSGSRRCSRPVATAAPPGARSS